MVRKQETFLAVYHQENRNRWNDGKKTANRAVFLSLRADFLPLRRKLLDV